MFWQEKLICIAGFYEILQRSSILIICFVLKCNFPANSNGKVAILYFCYFTISMENFCSVLSFSLEKLTCSKKSSLKIKILQSGYYSYFENRNPYDWGITTMDYYCEDHGKRGVTVLFKKVLTFEFFCIIKKINHTSPT